MACLLVGGSRGQEYSHKSENGLEWYLCVWFGFSEVCMACVWWMEKVEPGHHHHGLFVERKNVDHINAE